MNIGQKLKVFRTSQGLNQTEIAELLNISQSAYAKIEGNTTRLDVERLMELCKILDVDINEFFSTSDMEDVKTSKKEKELINKFTQSSVKDNFTTNVELMQDNYEARIARLTEQVNFLRSMVLKS